MASARFGNRDAGLDDANGIGFYSWIVPENKVHGDEVIASIFGISQEELAAGAPVEKVIRYVRDGDRQRLAKAIHGGIISGQTGRESYQVVHPDGRRIDVTSAGRCLRDADGVPSIYSGIVTILSANMPASASDPLEAHCRAALTLANQRRQMLAARYLSSALNVIGK